MTEIFLIRHGETDWNTERRLQGHIDIPLNDEGLRQAKAVARAMREAALDAIVSSDLQRAMQTAQAIAAAKNMPLSIRPALRERCYGGFEGLRHHDVRERFPAAFQAWQAREIDFRFPAGASQAETLREFSERAVAAVTALARDYPQQSIAVVTHGGVLECVYRACAGLANHLPRDFEIRNAGINRLRWHGERLELLEWGVTSHLTQAALDEVDQ